MAQFMLLLYDDPAKWKNFSAEELERAMQKYIAWTKKAEDSKRLGEDSGRVIRGRPGGKPVTTDGPYSETKEVLGGYYVIEAANYDEAVERTLDHPHLEYGGTIEVREVYSP